MSEINLSIIVPAYNEEKSITLSLSQLLNAFKNTKILLELIIINDGSTDKTFDLINNFKKTNQEINIIVLDNKINLGKSASLHCGIDIAGGKFTTIHDADLEYDPKDLVRMYNLINSNKDLDSVYGSRYLNKTKKNKQKKMYYMANLLNLTIFNFFFNSNISDLHSCYKIFKTNILKKFNLKEKRFGFELEVSTLVISNKLNMKEIPIFYNARNKDSGKKISFIDEIKFLVSIIKFRCFI